MGPFELGMGPLRTKTGPCRPGMDHPKLVCLDPLNFLNDNTEIRNFHFSDPLAAPMSGDNCQLLAAARVGDRQSRYPLELRHRKYRPKHNKILPSTQIVALVPAPATAIV